MMYDGDSMEYLGAGAGAGAVFTKIKSTLAYPRASLFSTIFEIREKISNQM